MHFRPARIALLAAVLLPGATRAPAAEFYEGKTITLLVGSDVGGGFDAFARLLARQLGRAIPGQPAVIVENMPGAGGGIAAGYIWSKAPKDGTVIGALNPGGLLAPLFEGRGASYDTPKFQFLGSANASTRVCVARKTGRIKSYADAIRETIVVGAGAVGSASFDYGYLHRNVHNGNFKIVAGYKGSGDILLAMERGEIDATCGIDWSGLKALRAGADMFPLLKVSVHPDAELDAMNVPEASSFASNETNRAIGELVGSQQMFGRPYAVAPGVPAERVAILRAAFDGLMSNKQFAAEAALAGLAIDAANAASVEASVSAMYAAPAAIIEGARQAIRP